MNANAYNLAVRELLLNTKPHQFCEGSFVGGVCTHCGATMTIVATPAGPQEQVAQFDAYSDLWVWADTNQQLTFDECESLGLLGN